MELQINYVDDINRVENMEVEIILKPNKNTILHERMKRQRLMKPIASDAADDEYIELFRLLQPVSPVHFTYPGSPPQLIHRTEFNDEALSYRFREQNRIIKGRFAGGRVGYVLQDDLERYATVFRRKLSKIKPIHEDIMSLIKSTGGISKDQLKDELDYPNGEISKALISLHEAFLVYEDQVDTDWDTGWFNFETEWFELKHDAEQRIHQVSMVLLNYLDAMVFATFTQIKDWSEMNIKVLKQAIEKLLRDGEIQAIVVDKLGEGYIRGTNLQSFKEEDELLSVFMLDKSDILVRSHMSELKTRYKRQEVLQYLLIDGEFKGAVLGHWRIGPHDIEDVLVELTPLEAQVRKEEIIQAVRIGYSTETTAILKYNGEHLL